jgi:hypothetical protein
MNRSELGQNQAQEFMDARAEFFARRKESKCSCHYDIYAINVGTNYFRIEERLEQYDPFCKEHGEPDCICNWGMAYGDWQIFDYKEDCPIHGEGNIVS